MVLSKTNFVSNAHKGSSQGFLLDVGNQTVRHEMAFIHAWERLEEGVVASTTAIAMSFDGNPDALASDRQTVGACLMAIQLVLSTMDTLNR